MANIILCEVFVKDFLPNIRSLLTKLLLERYNLKQYEVARILGITQGAVSQYYNTVRGSKTSIIAEKKEIMEYIESLAQRLVSEKSNEIDLAAEFCTICDIMRKSGTFNNTKPCKISYTNFSSE